LKINWIIYRYTDKSDCFLLSKNIIKLIKMSIVDKHPSNYIIYIIFINYINTRIIRDKKALQYFKLKNNDTLLFV
jgi:hypothetical protein